MATMAPAFRFTCLVPATSTFLGGREPSSCHLCGRGAVSHGASPSSRSPVLDAGPRTQRGPTEGACTLRGNYLFKNPRALTSSCLKGKETSKSPLSPNGALVGSDCESWCGLNANVKAFVFHGMPRTHICTHTGIYCKYNVSKLEVC